MPRTSLGLSLLLLLCLATGFAAGQARVVDPEPAAEPAKEAPEEAKPALPAEWAQSLPWRSIGPGNMGGRITALAVYEKDPTIWWASTASGGLLKTTNNGVTFEHQFDREQTVSIGDVAVAQSDPEIVWIGTGESNPRNSVSWGNGVYKSTDGGSTWKHMGLDDSFQIGRIAIHPTDPNVVYVGALGRLWGPNDTRGLYKTSDGGATWERVFFLDEDNGVIDVQMHPTNPDTLLIAAYERRRDGFDTNDPAVRFGEKAGLYKTQDAGKTWRRITEGLPTVKLGRIGIDYYRADPQTVFMLVESEKIGKEPENAAYMGLNGENAEVGARVTSVEREGPALIAGIRKGDIIIAVDGKAVHTYQDLIVQIREHLAGDQVKVEVSRDKRSVFLDLQFATRPDPKEGERRRRSPFQGMLGGQRENIQGQQGEDEHEYGGVYKSTDGGESWERVNSLNPRPMYFSQIRVDPTDDKYVYVLGVSLYKSNDGGKTFSNDGAGRGVHVDHHALWIDPQDPRHMILGNDGGMYVTYDRMENWDHHNQVAIGQFYRVAVSPERDYKVYGGLQDNGSWGGPNRVSHDSGPGNGDWRSVGGGDGFVCQVDAKDPNLVYFESQNGGMSRRHLVTGERARIRPERPGGRRRGPSPYRFNWNTPFVLSHHNSKIYYVAGNHVFRSLDRGEGLKKISPEISATKRGTATAFAESPIDPNVLYVGTDDGALWLTEDGGHAWLALIGAEESGSEASEVSLDRQVFYSMSSDDPPATPQRRNRFGRFMERLKQSDANGDGKIQRSEMPERLAGIFDRVDKDSDGVLSMEEIQEYAESRQSRRGAARGSGEGEEGRRRDPEARADDPELSNRSIFQLGSSLLDQLPRRLWVSDIVCSRFDAKRVYVTFDGHRSDDDAPYIFVTEDQGKTWAPLHETLPRSAGSVRTIEEDRVRADTLYLGTEFGAWVSIDRGKTWGKLGNLPTVAVHEFAQHALVDDLVAGTHGRSVWVLDVKALRQVSPETSKQAVTLYEPAPAVIWRSDLRRGATRDFTGRNPAAGASIWYSLEKDTPNLKLRITELDGKLVRELQPKTEAGFHRTVWNLRRAVPEGRRSRFRRGQRVEPGKYIVALVLGEKTWSQELTVGTDPNFPDASWLQYEELEEEFFRSDEDAAEEPAEDQGV